MKKISVLALALCLSTNVMAGENVENKSVNISSSCNISKDVTKDALNLADVIELSMCNNPTTRQAWLSTKVGETAYKGTLGSYLPQINASAGYTKSDTTNYMVDPNGVETIGKGAEAGLSLSWLLYDFGKRESAVEKTFQSMNSANFQYNNTLQTVAYNTIVAYYDALSAVEELAAVKANEEASLKSFELASKKFELGMSSKADTLQAETAYAQAQLQVTKQEQVVVTANAKLASYLGLPPSQEIKLVQSFADTTDELINKSVDDLVKLALAKRPDLQAKAAAVKASYASVRSASATYFPTISAFGSRTWTDVDPDSHNLDKDQDYWALGVKVTMPIFTGFENTYSLRNAKYQYAADKEALKQLEQDVELSVVTAYNGYKTSVKALSIAKKLFESAVENERVALGSFRAGKGDIISLMEAQSKLLSARKELIAAQYGLYTAKVALLKSAGELNLKNLGEFK
ncbi:MAG: TolC family protein [Alphaproteobacteria bacterium]|nr:TolC family protein [Alphaproteobacteria bacterium]